MSDDQEVPNTTGRQRPPWNKGKLTGAKPPLRPRHVWSIRSKLRLEGRNAISRCLILQSMQTPRLRCRCLEG